MSKPSIEKPVKYGEFDMSDDMIFDILDAAGFPWGLAKRRDETKHLRASCSVGVQDFVTNISHLLKFLETELVRSVNGSLIEKENGCNALKEGGWKDEKEPKKRQNM